MKDKIKIYIGVFISIIIIIVVFGYGSYFSKWFAKKETDSVLKNPDSVNNVNIIFLHHSTGEAIWDGGVHEWFKYFKDHFNVIWKKEETREYYLRSELTDNHKNE